MTKPKAILVDIDGTLANNDHRRHFIERQSTYKQTFHSIHSSLERIDDPRGKRDWKSYNEAMDKDTPNLWLVELIEKMSFSCCSRDIQAIFVTGREEKYRAITESFINTHVDLYTPMSQDGEDLISLFMRPDGDYRPDTEIKREIYEKHIKDKYDVLFCIDDRKCVVDLWRSMGLVCLDCAGYEG